MTGDYASRRSGGDPENTRRRSSSSFAPTTVTQAPPRESLDVRLAKHRKKPANYASRRSGHSQGISRRVAAGSSAALSRPPIDPRVARRRSVDYAARRSGAVRENQRSGTMPPLSTVVRSSTPPPRSGTTPIDPRVARRRSVDYAARRSGATRENQRSGSMTALSSSGRPGSAPIDPRVARRRSVDYSSRRSGGVREGARRSGASGTSGSVTPRNAVPMDRRVARRRTVDYAARRSGATRENQRSGNGSAPRSASATGLDGMSLRQPPIMRRRVPSYEARRSRNYDTAHQRRLRQQYTVGEVQAVLAARSNLPPTVVDALDKAARRLSGGAHSPQCRSCCRVL